MRSANRLRGSLAALVSIAAVACLAAPTAAGAAAPGVTVDDGAGVLSGATDRLHAAGQGLAAKRIPVLVATRSKQASSQQAVITEGQALLRDRQVESAPNARDGVVILLDVAPGGGRSFGAVVLGGRFSSYVPSSEPTTVYQNAMLPLLRSSDYAGAVSAGLTTLDNDLGSYSPPSGQAAPSRPGQAPAPASSSSFPWLPVILVVVLVLVIGGAALALLRRRSGGSGGGGYFASGGQSWVPPGGQPGAGYGPAGPGYGYGSGGGIGRGAAAAGGLLGGGLAGGLLGYELGKESGERQERDRELADGGYGGAQSGYPGGDDASGGSFGGGGDWGGDAGGGGGGDWGGGGDFGGGGGDGGGGGGDGGF